MFIFVFVLIAGLCPSRSWAAEDPLVAGWKQATGFLFNESNTSFQAAKGKPGVDERERRLGEAVALLSVQPRSQDNLERVRSGLEGIAAESGTDTAGLIARYLLGRYWEVQVATPDLDKAKTIFWDLAKEGSGNPIAEFGASKVALFELYRSPKDQLNAKAVELEAWEPLLTTSIGRREFHINLGMALFDLNGDPALVLKHLLAGDREGITRAQTESTVWVLIGDLAEKLGDKQTAATYFRKFVDRYKRDNRRYTVQERLNRLEANP